jgi:hypothetical protein
MNFSGSGTEHVHPIQPSPPQMKYEYGRGFFKRLASEAPSNNLVVAPSLICLLDPADQGDQIQTVLFCKVMRIDKSVSVPSYAPFGILNF